MTTKTKTYRCGVCGKQLKPERWVYSRFTGNRYCPTYCKVPGSRDRKRKESS